MRGATQVERSLVAVIAIDSRPTEESHEQARLVRVFLEDLNARLGELDVLAPDAFSSGDGVVVTVGRGCLVDGPATGQFLDFTIDLMGSLLEHGLSVRSALHYSQHDWLVEITPQSAVSGSYVQVGDAISVATRILAFCEPRELMISGALYRLLQRLGIGHRYSFAKNEDLIAKHQSCLETYTYAPAGDSRLFYSPHDPRHRYKRFSSFPPVVPSTFDDFEDPGLRDELGAVISNAYESLRAVNDTKSFLSWNSVIDVLREIHYDPDDTLYVLSRNDTSAGFWTQARRSQYIAHLRAHAMLHSEKINQRRVMIWNDDESPMPASPDDILFDLNELHLPTEGSLKSFPSSMLRVRYGRLHDLRFGGTFSEKHGFGIISVPPPETVDAQSMRPDRLGQLLGSFADYDVAAGPMKALVVADKVYVASLVRDMKRLLEDPQATPIDRLLTRPNSGS
jgi:hypothetical protein